jgi:hypothetical protein
VSKRSDAKKARRRKRQAAKGPRWTVRETDLDVVDEELTERGWEFDVDHSTDEMVTWYYPPSGIDTDDVSVETVTRLWLTEDEEWHLILAGSGEEGLDYVFDAEALLEHLDAIEAYRAGGPAFVAEV